MNRHSPEIYKCLKKAHEKMFNIICLYRNANQNHNELILHTHCEDDRCWVGVANWNPPALLGGDVNGVAALQSLAFPQYVKHRITM